MSGKEVVWMTPESSSCTPRARVRGFSEGVVGVGIYRTNSRETCRNASRARMRAAISLSDLALCSSALLDLRLRRRDLYDRGAVTMEDVEDVEVDVERESDESRPLAQRAIACSTRVEIAPRRPPNTELELELEDEVVVDMDSGGGDLGGDGGSPR